jgi:hypothetical protein
VVLVLGVVRLDEVGELFFLAAGLLLRSQRDGNQQYKDKTQDGPALLQQAPRNTSTNVVVGESEPGIRNQAGRRVQAG